MRESKNSEVPDRRRAASQKLGAGRWQTLVLIVSTAAVVLLLLAWIWWEVKSATMPVVKAGRQTRASAEPSAAGQPSGGAPSQSDVEFARLVGQWLRPDRGYIVSIESVESDGKTSAAYYNPHPIHVARAEGHRDGRALQLFVELQDVGYPGSYYRLTHDAATDQLSGIYYQAAQGVTYEVYFVRRQ